MRVLDFLGLRKRPTSEDEQRLSTAHRQWPATTQRSRHLRDAKTSTQTGLPVANDVANPHADTATDPRMPGDSVQLLEEVRSCTETVIEGVSHAKRVSESEIFAVGEVLRDIVVNARQLAQEMQKDVTQAIVEQEQSLQRFSEGVRSALQAQEAAVACVVAVTTEIQDAVTTINGLNHTAAFLAINAQIESAHLGEKGRAFGVISQQMRELSKTISHAAAQVGNATEGVQERLQQITEKAATLAEACVSEAAEYRQTATSLLSQSSSDGNMRLETILQLSNTAVSHLQFQDPMIQQLARVNGRMTQLRDWLLAYVSGDHMADSPSYQGDQAADNGKNGQQKAEEPAAGEVMLF
jgi:hypothetical protein